MKNPCESGNVVPDPGLKKVVCYFNILDICIAYDVGKEKIKFVTSINNCDKHIIDNGIYMLPSDVCPLGRTASNLLQYGKRQE